MVAQHHEEGSTHQWPGKHEAGVSLAKINTAFSLVPSDLCHRMCSGLVSTAVTNTMVKSGLEGKGLISPYNF